MRSRSSWAALDEIDISPLSILGASLGTDEMARTSLDPDPDATPQMGTIRIAPRTRGARAKMAFDAVQGFWADQNPDDGYVKWSS